MHPAFLSFPLAGKVARSAGWGSRGGLNNPVDHTIHRLMNVNVPKPQNAKTQVGKVLVSYAVALLTVAQRVLRSVHFDHQPVAEIGKVKNVTIKRNLSAKMKAVTIEMLQLNPEFRFFMRQRLAHAARLLT
jgi:hypothetical protein